MGLLIGGPTRVCMHDTKACRPGYDLRISYDGPGGGHSNGLIR